MGFLVEADAAGNSIVTGAVGVGAMSWSGVEDGCREIVTRAGPARPPRRSGLPLQASRGLRRCGRRQWEVVRPGHLHWRAQALAGRQTGWQRGGHWRGRGHVLESRKDGYRK